jgi:hypothetical protein
MVEGINNGYKYVWNRMFVNNIEYQICYNLDLGLITKVGTWQVNENVLKKDKLFWNSTLTSVGSSCWARLFGGYSRIIKDLNKSN